MTRRQTGLLGLGIFLWALFLTQGLPLWDDDFTSWIKRYQDRSTWLLFWDALSPLSTQPQHWGFNERPVQMILYRLAEVLSGDRGWAYFGIKSLTLSAMGVGVAAWIAELSRGITRRFEPALMGALICVVSGVTSAALVWHPDYAPLAEAWFLWSGLALWRHLEKLRAGEPVSHVRAFLIAAAVVIGYRTKADLKLLPIIAGTYVLFFPELRARWRKWVGPFVLMGLYLVPWGKGSVSQLPPFLPGSGGSSVGWMWQPASLDRLKDFFWLRESWGFADQWLAPSLALFWNAAFFILAGLVFLVWRSGRQLDSLPWTRLSHSWEHARLWVIIWGGWMTLAVAALPAINYTFRVRYGILLWVPFSILLGGGLAHVFAASSTKKLPRGLAYFLVGCFVLQSGLNLNKALRARHDLGAVMVAVDRAYRAVDARYPQGKLVDFPDFRPYDWRPASSLAVQNAQVLSRVEDIRSYAQPGIPTLALSWNPSFWEELDFEEFFSGCPGGVLFDALMGCSAGEGVYLYRYLGSDPDYLEGEAARKRGAHSEALMAYGAFLERHPRSFAGHFVVGLSALTVGDAARAAESWSYLERYFPHHLSVLYNHALALESLHKWTDALARLKMVLSADPKNYGAWYHSVRIALAQNQSSAARRGIEEMERLFPQDAEVKKLRQEWSAQAQ